MQHPAQKSQTSLRACVGKGYRILCDALVLENGRTCKFFKLLHSFILIFPFYLSLSLQENNLFMTFKVNIFSKDFSFSMKRQNNKGR